MFQVLYRFLDYLSKFDWDNYCVSLKGPVSKSSLPDIVGAQYICVCIIKLLPGWFSDSIFLL